MSNGLFASHLFEGSGGLGQSHTTAAEDAAFSSMISDIASAPPSTTRAPATTTSVPSSGKGGATSVPSSTSKGATSMPSYPSSYTMPWTPTVMPVATQSGLPGWLPFAIIGGGLLLVTIPIAIVFGTEKKPTANARKFGARITNRIRADYVYGHPSLRHLSAELEKTWGTKAAQDRFFKKYRAKIDAVIKKEEPRRGRKNR